MQIIGGRTASLLSTNGEGLTTIMPGFARAENQFLVPGVPLVTDLDLKLDQVASSDFVLVHKNAISPMVLERWPEFREALDGCELVFSSTRYELYHRSRPPR